MNKRGEKTMKRITWKKNTIISIALKDNTYCLAQMLQEPYLCFFNLFSKDDKWDDIIINQSDILFIKPIVRAFLKSGSVEKKTNIKPFAGSMKIDLWENTKDEISFIHLADKKGAMLIEIDFDTQNIDPMKMITFNKELPLCCKEYIKAISGEYTIEKLGY